MGEQPYEIADGVAKIAADRDRWKAACEGWEQTAGSVARSRRILESRLTRTQVNLEEALASGKKSVPIEAVLALLAEAPGIDFIDDWSKVIRRPAQGGGSRG